MHRCLSRALPRSRTQVLDRPKYNSKKGKTEHQLWLELCDLVSQHPDQIDSVKACMLPSLGRKAELRWTRSFMLTRSLVPGGTHHSRRFASL
jgi:hypothetical protein